MEKTKVWWKSRTIWAAVIGGLFSILGLFGVIPAGLSPEMVVEVVMGLVAIAVVLFRIDSDNKQIVSRKAE